MSGHSKWTQIKRQKAATDTKRGQLFTKLGHEITVAARESGGDPESNVRLRLAIQKARDNNMPMDNIERALKRGIGALEGEARLEEVVYEGYGPGGVAIMVATLTDNRNRTTADIRNIFTRSGGSLGEAGCVGWLFEPKGVIIIDLQGHNPDDVALVAIDAGADDVRIDGPRLEVHADPKRLEEVRKQMEVINFPNISSEVTMLAKTSLTLDEKDSFQVLKLLDRLEEHDDVQRVYSNADFPDEVLAKYAEE